MHITMLELMRLMADDILAEQAFATEFADEAEQAGRMGDANTAKLMRDLSRRHRVKGLELDGRLAAMRVQYTTMFQL